MSLTADDFQFVVKEKSPLTEADLTHLATVNKELYRKTQSFLGHAVKQAAELLDPSFKTVCKLNYEPREGFEGQSHLLAYIPLVTILTSTYTLMQTTAGKLTGGLESVDKKDMEAQVAEECGYMLRAMMEVMSLYGVMASDVMYETTRQVFEGAHERSK